MCKSCNAFSWNNNYLISNEAAHSDAITSSQLAALGLAGGSSAAAFFQADGLGDFEAFNPFVQAGLIGAGPDDAPNTRGPGVPTVTVHPIGTAMSPATRTVGTIELNGDQDYRQITLVAGKTYEIHMYALAGGPNAVPLPDAYLELYGAAGNFITAADGGAHTPANEVNSGFDVLLTFTAQVSGTYYINSRAFDNDPTDGTTGEGVGDYELFVREVDPDASTTYQPFYDLDDPLHSIDWGSRLINKVHQTARNPDGDEGTRGPNAEPGIRPTGNDPGDPAPYSGPNQAPTTGNPGGFPNAPDTYDDPLVDSSTDADINPVGDPTPLKFDIPGKNVITVYYARAGEEYKYDDPTQPGLTEILPAQGFKPFEIDAMRLALGSYSDVADIVYIEVEQAYVPADPINPAFGMRAHADLTILLYAGTFRTGLLGRHSAPDEGNEGQGEYNNLGPGWEAGKLVPGGFSFVTLIHELGHAHGLAHPHDTGGGSSIMRGVEPALDENGVPEPFNYTLGDYDLNQAAFTVMSYQDGWPKSPYGNAPTSAGYGYQTGLSAFDIAVIQDKYGVNEETRTGNDVYLLPDANAVAILNPDGTVATKATGYSAIWDAGGIDEIRYDGARNANIDLRAATLKYEVGGGGWMSYTTGATPVYAGFTIANGAIIENATGGSGNDSLRGNTANNVLNGGAGNDVFWLQDGGVDTALGGAGNDAFYAGAALTAADTVSGGEDRDQLALQGNYALTLGSVTGIEDLILLSGTDTRFGDAGTGLYGYAITSIDSNVAAGATLLVDGTQLIAGESMTFNGSGESDGKFLLSGGKGVDTMTGGAGSDGFFFRDGSFWGAGDKVTGGASDQIGFRGDFTGANKVVMGADQIVGVETLVMMSGTDTRFGPAVAPTKFDIQMHDGNVGATRTFTIDGTFLTSAETMRIDGSGELDGAFRMFGGAGADTLIGGAGSDRLRGNGGADTLTGNGGADRFVYGSAADSTGAGFDLLTDVKSAEDVLDLDVTVSGWNATVTTGQLRAGSFDADLAVALDGALDPGKAILFDPNGGDMAGRHFLVVDGNGDGVYTAGADYVFELGASAIVDTSGAGFFV